MIHRHSRFQFPRSEVVLRRDTEGVGDAIEKGEHRGDVDGFCDLVFCPACVTKFLNILGGRAVGSVGDQLDIVQQSALRRIQPCFVKFAFDDSLYAFILCSLDTQEVGMTIQSIGTTIQIGDITRD
jgi:hypothetical protein